MDGIRVAENYVVLHDAKQMQSLQCVSTRFITSRFVIRGRVIAVVWARHVLSSVVV
jgi:hypothetical protein